MKKLLASLAILVAFMAGPSAYANPVKDTVGIAPIELLTAQAQEKQPTLDETFKMIGESASKMQSALAKQNVNRVTITNDYGGSIVEFIAKYNAIQQSGGQISIPDICISACTLVTGLVDSNRVCVSNHTVFGFHSASTLTPFGSVYSEEGTHLLWAIYPESIRTKLRDLGFDNNEHPGLVYIRGTDLYEVCND